MMATRTMDVAMIELLCRRITNICDFDVKNQSDAGHRVIAVQGNLIAIYRNDGDQLNAFR